MAREPFLLLSMKQDKVRKLAKVISNDTCRRIVDYLARKEETETEIAKKLNIPLSTVHYNLQHLVSNRLVRVDEFHYSKKGKEVNHYKLSNRLIIIAPKETSLLRDRLKSAIPAGIITVVAAFLVNIYARKMPSQVFKAAAPAAKDLAVQVEESMAAAPPPMAPTPTPDGGLFSNIALWFLVGAVFVILAYLLTNFVIKKLSKR